MSRVIGRRLHATCCNGAPQTPEKNLCRPVVVPGKNRKRSERLFIVSIKPNGQCGLKPRGATSSKGIGVDLCRRDR